MSVPTARSLVAALGHHLSPAPGVEVPDIPVSAVHISEQLDPTGYLSGGELLLTIGMSVPSDEEACAAYVARLTVAGVVAIGFGLGPLHRRAPEVLLEACRTGGLPLLLVPEPTPFITISRAYWGEVARSGERPLVEQLVAQRALVDAATSDQPTRSMLRTLARWADGWTAVLSAAGAVEHVEPAHRAEDAARLGSAVRHLAGRQEATRGPASGTVVTDGSHVAVFPLTGSGRPRGYLVVGVATPLEAGVRRTVHAGAALLGLLTSEDRVAAAARDAVAGGIAGLLDVGHVDAARELAASRGQPGPTDRVRVIAVRSRHLEVVAEVVRAWGDPSAWEQVDAERSWFVLPPRGHAVTELGARLREQDPLAAAALAGPVPLGEVGAARSRVMGWLDEVADGQVELEPVRPRARTVERALDRLHDVAGDEVVAALRGYLQHHGQWEPAARALGLHRNTLRYRVTKARAELGVDLEDPDVRAHLWLALGDRAR